MVPGNCLAKPPSENLEVSKSSKVSKAWILGVADEIRLPMKGLPSDRRLGLSRQDNARGFRFDPGPRAFLRVQARTPQRPVLAPSSAAGSRPPFESFETLRLSGRFSRSHALRSRLNSYRFRKRFPPRPIQSSTCTFTFAALAGHRRTDN